MADMLTWRRATNIDQDPRRHMERLDNREF